MMDHAELDFGIYRIMNYKRDEINKFLNQDLLPQVDKVLKENVQQGNSQLQEELEKAIEQCHNLGIDPSTNSKVIELKEKMEQTGVNLADLQNVVFSRLTQFFSRYYEDGDFVSQRRYKTNGSAYAIPYNGEEVKLYWANADQYYIKTSEYFKNYTFKLPTSNKKVHFVLKDASTEQNNNKNVNGMERRFKLYEEEDQKTIDIVNDELEIYFTYELMPKATKQKVLNEDAFKKLQTAIPADFNELLMNVPQKDVCWLEKHLLDYTAKNSFDYFIHKDLGGFLTRELDFYIKNEVFVIQDLDYNIIQSQIAVVKAIESIGGKIIEMLAQIENFQKKLWLKKKFVVGCDYCITLDRIDEKFYPEICANDAQREEWVKLFAIDEIKGDAFQESYSEPLNVEFLKQNKFLVLDTAFFSSSFKHKLLSRIKNIDENCNGLMVNSENSQALHLITYKYQNAIQTTYIDPPYNTVYSKILYKNNYEHSTWLSLMNNTIPFVSSFWTKDFSFGLAIDDFEFVNLARFLDNYFPTMERSVAIVNHHPQGSGGRLSRTHEYYIMISPKDCPSYLGEPLDDYQEDRNFMRSGRGENNFRQYRWKSFYALLMDPITRKIVDVEDAVPLDQDYPTGRTNSGLIRIYPINSMGEERVWRSSFETGRLRAKNDELFVTARGTVLQAINHESKREVLMSNWTDVKFNAGTNGTNLLDNMGLGGLFDYPKSLHTLQTGLWAQTYGRDNGYILDYFAGSGTTGHAVINMNRKFGGNRKYILVEMGNYFSSATRPRIQKAIYSENWKLGKPIDREGISQCFKYIRLEQYEDTLNNIQLKSKQGDFHDDGEFHESYMLRYMLDTETKDSLFNIKSFARPFDFMIKTTKDNELVDTPVDLVETFNYLIGLKVDHISWHKDDNICVVEGTTNIDNEHTLVIWRNTDVIDNVALNEFLRKQDYSALNSEFDIIYVNGDNTLQNAKRDDEHWKVMLIEMEFQKRMFEEA